MLSTLLAASILGVVMVAAVAASRGESSPPARLAAVPALPVAQEEAAVTSVPSASGAVLAEMNRRLGTPRRVSISARRRARAIARIEARLLEQQRVAEARRAAAARAAAIARNSVPANAPYWFDQQAAAQTTRGPVSVAEANWLNTGRGGWVEANGYARAPANAPEPIRRAMQAGNLIARSPYLWGGGHGTWRDRGYDCSGSVSYALAAGGMLGTSLTSGQLMNWGAPGPGRWLTIYANQGHVFMYVAGLRFDTSGRAGYQSSRWQLAPRPADGFAVRHYPGL
jgi:cell wall-associated NlpC family hydrolase